VTRDEAKTGAVAVPRAVLLSLVAALATAILLVAYFMGRESARKSAQASPAPMAAPAQTAPAAMPATEPAPAAPSPFPSSVETPPASVSDPAPQSPATAPLAPVAQAAQPAPATDRLHDDVARYFREVETIQSQAKSSGDPETLARTLLEQGMKGDESGFDGLVAANRKVLEALRDVQVPEPCREHHRLTLGLMDESIAMLGRVKSQLSGGDEAALAALPAQGRELERKAKEADALAAEIKKRFGV
jgi:hypothetical protein